MKKLRAIIEREAKPYCAMWDAAVKSANRADKQEDGWWWDCLSSLTFSAFTVEGYLNHLGARIYPDWADLERLEPMAKLRFLCRHLELRFSAGERPHQTIHALFRWRNQIAHPKSEKVVIEGEMDQIDYDEATRRPPETEWEKWINKRNLAHVREDVLRVLHQLHNAADAELDGDIIFSEGGWSGSAEVIQEKETAQQQTQPDNS